MRHKIDRVAIYLRPLRELPPAIDGYKLLLLPAACPVTLDELIAAGDWSATTGERHQPTEPVTEVHDRGTVMNDYETDVLAWSERQAAPPSRVPGDT
ncbi:MAG TPA: hypothetical protein VFW75_08570 [Acetobacteraceae bacterium]|nr:hypothetical protein [Acetobacteraceae bacterium]